MKLPKLFDLVSLREFIGFAIVTRVDVDLKKCEVLFQQRRFDGNKCVVKFDHLEVVSES